MPIRTRRKPKSTCLCFGTLDREEFHADFSLVPKDVRYYASLKFLAAARPPSVYTNVAFVYDRTLGSVSIRKQKRKRVEVGDLVY